MKKFKNILLTMVSVAIMGGSTWIGVRFNSAAITMAGGFVAGLFCVIFIIKPKDQ